MPEDVAITSSKSDVDPCSHGRETDRQKSADGQTDGQTAFQLYIVDWHEMAITSIRFTKNQCNYIFVILRLPPQ